LRAPRSNSHLLFLTMQDLIQVIQCLPVVMKDSLPDSHANIIYSNYSSRRLANNYTGCHLQALENLTLVK